MSNSTSRRTLAFQGEEYVSVGMGDEIADMLCQDLVLGDEDGLSETLKEMTERWG